MDDRRRLVPRTDTVLADAKVAPEIERLGRTRVRLAVSQALERCRSDEIAPADVVDEVLAALPKHPGGLRPVINATGVIVHTNLGRAPLSEAARTALARAAGATDVELDLTSGQRGPRGRSALAALRRAVPDAEDVLVVNNGAAALSLVAHALASGREVVIARGELVEIGDGFRIADLLEASGARLREVGSTNRVTLADYTDAITDETALVAKVHPSNFRVSGFTASVGVAELARLPVPVVADIGSGLLQPHPRLPDEPDATSTLRAGAALVTASGDKLLGGPQSGLVLGRAHLVAALRRHPMARAVRVDKLTLAALEATLEGPPAPVALALATTRPGLLARAEAISQALASVVPDARAEATVAMVGGGGAPGVELDSAGVSLPATLGPVLRNGSPAILGRLVRDRLVLDLIAVEPSYDDAIVEAVQHRHWV